MISEQIEKIKSEYTDKYVTVRAEKPELVRFKNYVGQVKTVNMSSRALVQFDDFDQNTGWYDIELDYLKVVDKPLPKESRKPAERQVAGKLAGKKPAAADEKKLSPLELARQQGAAKSSDAIVEKVPAVKKSAGKPSTTDILAAARAGSAKSPASKATGAAKSSGSAQSRGGKTSTADILAAARGGSAKSPAQAAGQTPKAKGPAKPAQQAGSTQPKGGKQSTADILAAARGDSAKSPAPKTKGAAEPAETESHTAVQASGAANASKSAQPTISSGSQGSSGAKGSSRSKGSSGAKDKSDMSPEDICAWCREHDAV